MSANHLPTSSGDAPAAERVELPGGYWWEPYEPAPDPDMSFGLLKAPDGSSIGGGTTRPQAIAFAAALAPDPAVAGVAEPVAWRIRGNAAAGWSYLETDPGTPIAAFWAEVEPLYAALTPRAAAEGNDIADLREEVGYWRRDAAARIWSAKALMQAYRKEGRHDLAFAHRESLRAAVGASEEVQGKDWHTTCELCGKPMLPGEATYYFAEEGISAHDRCAVEGAKDDTGAPDPTDADWIARTAEGRAALTADNDDAPVAPPAPARGAVDLAGVEGLGQAVHAFAQEYEHRDPDHTPTEAERAMLEDFGNALLERLNAAIARTSGTGKIRRDALEEAAALLAPTGPRPCDCEHCDCGNPGDHAHVVAWDEANASAAAIRALATRTSGTGSGVLAELRRLSEVARHDVDIGSWFPPMPMATCAGQPPKVMGPPSGTITISSGPSSETTYMRAALRFVRDLLDPARISAEDRDRPACGATGRNDTLVAQAAEAKALEERERRLMHGADSPLVKLLHQGRMFDAMQRREAAEAQIACGATRREG